MLRGVNRRTHMSLVKEINDGRTGVGYYGSAQGNQFPSYPSLNNIPASAPLTGNLGSISQLYIFSYFWKTPFYIKTLEVPSAGQFSCGRPHPHEWHSIQWGLVQENFPDRLCPWERSNILGIDSERSSVWLISVCLWFGWGAEAGFGQLVAVSLCISDALAHFKKNTLYLWIMKILCRSRLDCDYENNEIFTRNDWQPSLVHVYKEVNLTEFSGTYIHVNIYSGSFSILWHTVKTLKLSP